MKTATQRQSNASRLRADVASVTVELLSAQCAMDRVRLQYSLQDVVACGERETLRRAVASVEALHRFFSQIDAEIRQEEGELDGEQ